MVGSIQTQSLHFGRISRKFFLFCNAKTDLIRSKNPVAGKFVRHLNSVLFNSLISQSRVLWLRSPHYRQSYILHGRVVERKRKSKFFRISLQISFPLLLNEPFQIRELLSQSSPPSNTFSISVQRLGDFFYYAPPEIFFISSVFGIVLYNQPSPDGCTDGCEKVVPPPCHMISLSCSCCSFIITDADDGDFGGVAVHKTLIHSVDNG